MNPQDELDALYEKIGGTGYSITNADLTRIDELNALINPPQRPLTFTEWCDQADVETHYNAFHDEYGDSACFLSDYKEYHYNAYLDRHNRESSPLGLTSLWP